MNISDLYSIKNCNNNKQRFINVGYTELERNSVFFDTETHIYIKHYQNRSHYENERNALLFYSDCKLIPDLINEFDMCICISAMNGCVIEENNSDLSVYREMGDSLRNLHSMSKKILNKPLDMDYYFLYEKKRLDNLFDKINCRDQVLYEMLLQVLTNDICQDKTDIVLCHNDYCNRNLILSNNKVSGIIDFEKSHFADQICDLATIIIKKYKTRELMEMLKSYFKFNISYNQKQRMVYFAIYKALEITTWAKNKDMEFYNKAVNFLDEWKLLYDIT